MHKHRETIIKKYPNRRLYNTATSTYVKFEDLADLIRSDQDFTVVDSKTNEDLTKQTLAQIILDQESKYYEMMPENLIKTIIKLSNNPLRKSFENFAQESVKVFEQNFSQNMMLDSYSKFNKEIQKIAQNNLEFMAKLFKGSEK
jgi:polyhydroxyalkanoate synthesis repressor PhaR